MGRAELEALMGDLRDRLIAWLVTNDFDVSPAETKDVSRALEACLRVRHRTISPRARRVHWSRELRARPLDAATRMALAAIEAEFQDGQDLNPRLTRRYFDAGFDDRLLNDLGVTHLHLGATAAGKDKTGKRAMAGGTSEILWVVVRPDSAHFIDVLDHTAFSTFDFVKVIHGNWKHLLGDPFDGWSDLEPKLSPVERAQMRRIGINVPIEVDGEIFIPGGYMKSGTSNEVAHEADRILNRVVEMHKWLSENRDVVLSKVEAVTGARPATLDERVGSVEELLAGRPTLVEPATGMLFYWSGRELRYRLASVAR